jgi:hypothetical protein
MINNINDLIKASDKFSMPEGKIEMNNPEAEPRGISANQKE